MTRKYPVIYEWGGKNFSGYAPNIAGCVASARTLPKMRAELKSALEAHLQWMKNDGDTLPQASMSTTVDMTEDREFPNPPGYYVVVEWLEVAMPKAKQRRTTRKQGSRELVAA